MENRGSACPSFEQRAPRKKLQATNGAALEPVLLMKWTRPMVDGIASPSQLRDFVAKFQGPT